MASEHSKRVNNELRAAGVSYYGRLKSEARHLPDVIHPTEHIGGAIYGQIKGSGLFDSGFLIATDRRVIFYDHKPMYSTLDEVTYDVVSGVKADQVGLFASVVLHTKVKDYILKFVNPKCAHIFVEYIEKRRLDTVYKSAESKIKKESPQMPHIGDARNQSQGLTFLKNHDTAVLSTIDRQGNPHGAVVYYITDDDNYIYILTKSETEKGHNVYAHKQVALTIFEADTLQTAQVKGEAKVETDQKTKELVFSKIVKPHSYRHSEQLPPVTRLHEGSFMVIKISPTSIKYHDFTKVD